MKIKTKTKGALTREKFYENVKKKRKRKEYKKNQKGPHTEKVVKKSL